MGCEPALLLPPRLGDHDHGPPPELYAYRPHLGNIYRRADGDDPMDGRQRRLRGAASAWPTTRPPTGATRSGSRSARSRRPMARHRIAGTRPASPREPTTWAVTCGMRASLTSSTSARQSSSRPLSGTPEYCVQCVQPVQLRAGYWTHRDGIGRSFPDLIRWLRRDFRRRTGTALGQFAADLADSPRAGAELLGGMAGAVADGEEFGNTTITVG